MTDETKGVLLKTAGWVTVGVGVYLIALGNKYDGTDLNFSQRPSDDTIIEAVWSEVD